MFYFFKRNIRVFSHQKIYYLRLICCFFYTFIFLFYSYPQLPCLQIGNVDKGRKFPLEVLNICEQKKSFNSDDQKQTLIKVS